jgi:cobalt/nickel transport system ATP-binding protein
VLALEISNLSYHYPDMTPALKGINLQFKKGKKTAILGTNGSGKTTLIYHINGIIPASKGSVRVFGRDVIKENLNEVRREVGLLFDNPDNQLFSTTVFGDVAFGPRNQNIDPEMVNKRVDEAMLKMGIEELAERPPYCLSLGQKKRAAIAGLLAMKPGLLAFDEPFSGLDPDVGSQFRDILDQLVQKGTTLIYSTHDVNLAYAWADEVVIMKGGRVLASGEYDLLQDETVLHQASLPLPMLAQLFRNNKEQPRTMEEAMEVFEKQSSVKQAKSI